jgi:ABC-type oligopeptide transport system substrate-binding subunit
MANEIYVNLYGTIGEVYNAFKSGDIDIMLVGNSNIEQYIGSLGYNRIEFKSRDYDFLTLNCLDPNLQNPKMRKALSLILDKNALIAACLGEGYVSSNFPLDYGEWLYTRDLGVETNHDEAKKLITEC